MPLINIKTGAVCASFQSAVLQGLGDQGGLFFPETIQPLPDLAQVLNMPFLARSSHILQHLIGADVDHASIDSMVQSAFNFPVQLQKIDGLNANTYALELFHGPSLAFKDFGARFLGQCLKQFQKHPHTTILTATSGDTGGAVAHALHGLTGIRAVILYPDDKVSALQRKLFTTQGDNIQALAVQGNFDDCQQLVKACFSDHDLVTDVGLNSANSINIARLLAQVCYYFEACAQLPDVDRKAITFAVPSGNFGNVTAAAIAATLGLPVTELLAVTNSNDTVPRFLQNGDWAPNPTVETLSNAMDISIPNNWPRMQYLMDHHLFDPNRLSSMPVSESDTRKTMLLLAKNGYIAEPHAAVAAYGLQKLQRPDTTGIFLGTAHPAKFQESVETILGQRVSIPESVQSVMNQKEHIERLDVDLDAVKKVLRRA